MNKEELKKEIEKKFQPRFLDIDKAIKDKVKFTDVYSWREFREAISESFDKGTEQSRKETMDILEKMGTLDTYYDKEMAIKTLILAERLISGELTFEDIELSIESQNKLKEKK